MHPCEFSDSWVLSGLARRPFYGLTSSFYTIFNLYGFQPDHSSHLFVYQRGHGWRGKKRWETWSLWFKEGWEEEGFGDPSDPPGQAWGHLWL